MEKANKQLTIAVDGHSSCGKSTLAKALAKELNITFLDSGAMYRGVTLFCSRNGWVDNKHINPKSIIENLNQIEIHFEEVAATGLNHMFLNNEDVEEEIRTMKISNLVSKVAAIKEVRTKLVDIQQQLGKKGGVVMDGRDIGSVVFPNADIKLFVTAGIDIRAQRRFDELKSKDTSLTIDAVKANLAERDHLDSTREESPLIKTNDATVLDNSNLNKNEQLLWVLRTFSEIL
jgi:cytidylate kinase